jgi:phage portal protein BeeE
MNWLVKAEMALRNLTGIGKSLNALTTIGFQEGYLPPGFQNAAMVNAYKTLPWLRATFGKISEGVSSTTFYSQKILEKRGKRSFVRSRSLLFARKDAREKLIAKFSKSDDYDVKVFHETPLLNLLSDPNEWMTGPALLGLTSLYLDLVGRAVWMLKLGEGGIPVEIWPIPPGWINKWPDEKDPTFHLSDRLFPARVHKDDCVIFSSHDPADPYRSGVGAATPLADELEADEYAAKHVRSWFINRARPDVIISGTGIGADEKERAEMRWRQKFSGFMNAHLPTFMTRDVKVHELNNSFSDMELVSLRKWQRNVVLQSAGLPPEILGVIESSNRATISAASFIFARYVLVPRIEIIRAGIQKDLAPKLLADNEILDYVSPVEENREFKLEVYKEAPWSFMIDDWRALAGDPPLPSDQGKAVMVPAQYTPTRVEELDDYEHPYATN